MRSLNLILYELNIKIYFFPSPIFGGPLHMLTKVPSFQSPHVHIPVQSQEHDHGEDDTTQNTKQTHHKSKHHIEEDQDVSQEVIQSSARHTYRKETIHNERERKIKTIEHT